MLSIAHEWDIPGIIATISQLRAIPRGAGQRFGGVTPGDALRVKAARFAESLHADYRHWVEPPEIAATIDGGIAFRWRRPAGPLSMDRIEVEIVFVEGEIEYAVTPVGDSDRLLDEGAVQDVGDLLREVVKRHLIG